MALRGFKVIELAGLAPAPLCGMILSDHGASVTRIDKPGAMNPDTLCRGKRSIILDLKKPSSVKILTKLCLTADVLIEPFRPGIMEKYKLGPSDLSLVNPKLIYARLTGFGQGGPFSKMAGHDINYIAISGVLSMLGDKKKPQPPINMMGDFAGGGLICALGICLALLERQKSGKGQVIDANMVEGSAYVSSWLWTTRTNLLPFPLWGKPRGENVLDGGAPFYQTFETKDGKFMAVGALEPQFFKELLKGLGLNPEENSQLFDWPELEQKFRDTFLTKTQEEWCKIFDFTDACVTPVVSLPEAHDHPHNVANGSFVKSGDQMVPVPAPRLSRSPGEVSHSLPHPGQHSFEILLEMGYQKSEIDDFIKEGVVQASSSKSML